ncbi:hypothetical protein N9917_00385 [Deltaproteobacteria bacterium]|nr:hypothetical protein [Deltaproteobacteria bacterium]
MDPILDPRTEYMLTTAIALHDYGYTTESVISIMEDNGCLDIIILVHDDGRSAADAAYALNYYLNRKPGVPAS